MTSSDVRSPGGWLQLINARVAAKLIIGLLAVNGAVSAGQGVLDVYGKFQGAQASHYCESRLVSATAKSVTYSCLNPLPEGISGAVLFDASNGIFVNENTSPLTRLDVGTATGATYSGQNIFNSIVLNGAKRWLSVTGTGASKDIPGTTLVTNPAPVILAPRNYDTNARKYLTFTFSAGSGQTLSGEAPAFARFLVVPCSVEGVGC